MKKWIAALPFMILMCAIAPNCSNDGSKASSKDKQPVGTSVRKKVTFVELGSVKCIPCKMMQPVMKAIEEEYGTEVDVVFHDVWTADGEPYGRKYGIRVIPTQVFLDAEGKEFFRHEGYYPKDEIVKMLKSRGVGT